MNQIFAGSFALILALLLWGLGKKSRLELFQGSARNLSRNQNQEQTSLVSLKKEFEQIQPSKASSEFSHDPKNTQERLKLRKNLAQLISAGPEERFLAVTIAKNWKDPAVLPILKRGLRDPDSRIVAIAAQGIERFKSSSKGSQNQESLRPPLNVSRMR